MSMDTLSAFIEGSNPPSNPPSEEKTLDGACEALYEAVNGYVSSFKEGLGRKTKDNSEWKRVVGKYYGISRVVQGRWDEICDRVVEMGLLGIQESDGGREYWKPLEQSELELHKEPISPDSDLRAETHELELQSDEDTPDWDYSPHTEPEKEVLTWEGFTPEELEIIEILNMAYLRGHTLYEQGDKPSFYDAHRWALVHDKPLAVNARLKKNEHGQHFGYCHDADGRYTGGLFNCAVLSANHGGGIMDKEDKALVKKFCMGACENCPNKKWSKSGS